MSLVSKWVTNVTSAQHATTFTKIHDLLKNMNKFIVISFHINQLRVSSSNRRPVKVQILLNHETFVLLY